MTFAEWWAKFVEDHDVADTDPGLVALAAWVAAIEAITNERVKVIEQLRKAA